MMNHYEYLCRQPLRLLPNRVRRTYIGGKMLDRRRGDLLPQDSGRPEEWIASVTAARNPGFQAIENEGLGRVALGGGETALLRDVIHASPDKFLGRKHVEKYGDNLTVLVKIIDSAERLTIQVHPDKAFAKKVFGSDFGKTEAWYVIGTREADGMEPYMLLGFKPGVTKEEWERVFHVQDIPAMVSCLHKVKPTPGDVYLIEGGVPHAIGPGCCLIEIQEPTDFTLRTERITPGGAEIPEPLIHQGAGPDNLFDCFHYDARPLAKTLEDCKVMPFIVRKEAGGTTKRLLGPNTTDKFSMEEIEVSGCVACSRNDSFSIAVVLSGYGSIAWDGGTYKINASGHLFIPHALQQFSLENSPESDQPLRIVRCCPPSANQIKNQGSYEHTDWSNQK